MRWRSLSLLALLLALAAVVYYALETKGKRSESAANRLFQAEEKNIERISIKRGEELIVLKREGDGWLLTEPIQAKADSLEVASLLHKLLEASEERRIEEAPRSLADYGLEHPPVHLSLTLTGGKSLPALLLGDVNPNGRSIYAKRAEQPAVFLVPVTLRVGVDRKPDDFRDRTLLALEPDLITQIELARKGQSISLSNTGAGRWEMRKPIKARADAGAVSELLWKIKETRVKAFVDSGSDAPRRYGFDRPDLIIDLTEANTSKRLQLKKAADPNIGLYALPEPGEGVVTIDAHLLTDLYKLLPDLADRSLLHFDTTQVKTIQLRRGGTSLTLTKEGEVWKLTAPILADAELGKVSDLFSSLKELRYTELIQEKGEDLARYGLKVPHAEVELTMKDGGSRLPALLIGKTEKDRLYAKLAADPAVYAIDPKFLDRIPKGPDALKQQTRPATGR